MPYVGPGCSGRHGRQPRVTSEIVKLLPLDSEELQHMPENSGRASKLALPDCEHFPSICSERTPGTTVSFDILGEFRLPEVCASLGGSGVTTAIMAVPETSMDKYTGSESGEYNIRASRKVPAMKPKSVTVGMEEAPYDHLRSCVSPLDTSHHARSGCRVNDIHSSPFYSSVNS